MIFWRSLVEEVELCIHKMTLKQWIRWKMLLELKDALIDEHNKMREEEGDDWYLKTGSELKAVRESLGLSVSKAANLTKMGRQSIYNVECGNGPERNFLYLELFYEDYRYKRLINRWKWVSCIWQKCLLFDNRFISRKRLLFDT